jgi:lactoylglutathione lyase
MQIRFLLFSAVFFLVGFTAVAQQQKPTLNHIALYVTDLKKSTAFYQDIVHLDTIPEPFHDGLHTWFGIGPLSHLHLIQGATAAAAHDKHNHLCFTEPSLQEFTMMLDKNNIDYESWAGEKKSVTLRVDKVKQVYFQDPDGYWIEINDAMK